MIDTFSCRVGSIAAAVLAAVLLPSCKSAPLATSAQAGATLSVALGGDQEFGDVLGYGSAVASSIGVHDDQRGMLEFYLDDGAVQRPLETRIVTRLRPDPASEIGLQETAIPGCSGLVCIVSDALGITQVVAVIRIPPSVPPGPYTLKVRRERRTGPSAPPVALATVPYEHPIQIVAGAGTPTPERTDGPFGPQDLSPEELVALVPHPKLVLAFSEPPAAAHFAVGYDPARVTVRAVIEEESFGRDSAVMVQDDPQGGRVVVDFADQTPSVKALALVFEVDAPYDVLTPADFEVEPGYRLYDEDGALLPGSATLEALSIR